ncbi:hypothetical protein Curi_c15100 [Gottschalkia acidurici 9a]|uniref:Phage protein n=1 Tax=Gottschalkia acidurici (strain ATCC 7906 / DSM 604 / BCRC 14475 / CIP 104303 / KCTC 5404 / NCIMB 10678 / 9a) TaxID=1128398 RepID=K0AZ30_GOTA9|nr:phage holin, LLH family [Gottschalkia acidurici]AFS78519.1 hypothetical protein Curi_c15100 [Gottschalkia acidurici 9a]
MNLITENINSLALIATTTLVLFYLYKKGKKVLVKRVLRDLVTKAEEHYTNGQGKRKRQYVIKEFYKKAPILKIFLSEKELDSLIELAVEELKEKLN